MSQRASRWKTPTLIEMWQEHMTQEFVLQDVDATMRTMTPDAVVLSVPLAMGGRGAGEVRQFYARHFIGRTPRDLRVDLVSRTADAERLVDEMLISFTHDIAMPWVLPGVAPTGRKVAIPVVAIIAFQGGKVASEHLYWDQASVLAQLGLLPSLGLPVEAERQAEALIDPSVPLNRLLAATDERR